MLMLIIQFQFMNTTDEEQELIPNFCNWLCSVLYSKIDTKINRKKIYLRLDYLLNKVDWIVWGKDKDDITVSEIMTAIYESIIYQQHRNNNWTICINTNVLIPHSLTSIDRLIRFLNYGDNIQRATGIFTDLEREYNHNKLNTLWNLYTLKNTGSMSNAKIISR